MMGLTQETEAWKMEGSLRKTIPEKGNLLSRGKMGTHTSNGQTSGMGMLQETGGKKIAAKHDCFRERREGSRQKCSEWAGNVVIGAKGGSWDEQNSPCLFSLPKGQEGTERLGSTSLDSSMDSVFQLLLPSWGKECQPGFPSLFCPHFPKASLRRSG